MKEENENKKSSYNITNELFNKFIYSYKKLERGQKQMLHRLVIDQLQIPYKETTIRAYCTNFERIPSEKRRFFITLITGSLIVLYNQLSDQWSESIADAKDAITNLSKSLKEYGTQHE